MKAQKLRKAKDELINFLFEATQNRSELKYIIFNYLHGTIFGCVLWNYVIFELSFAFDPFSILFLVVVAFGVGCCLFIGVRCVVTLVWIEFLGKTGINLLKALILLALISGPVENLKLNAKEVVRVFQCSSELMFNLTISKVTLLSKPFQNAIRETSTNLSQIQDSLDMITDVVSPLVDEIEVPFNRTDNGTTFSMDSRLVREGAVDTNTDAKSFQQQYITKINARCVLQMESAVKKCERSFSDAYDRCYDKLPSVVNTMLCWPMKMDALCYVFKTGDTDKLCDSSNVIDRDFGDTYAELKSLEQSLQKQKNDKVNIDTTTSINPSAEIKTMKEINRKFTEEIDQKSKVATGFVVVVRKILSLVLLLTIWGAYKYYRKYLSQIDFDNRFVTDYFEKIDLRRKNGGRMNLLPLTALERKSIVVSKSSKVKLNELWFMVPFLVKLLFEIMFASCILIFNHLMYVSLFAVAQHGEITYHQEGEIVIETAVNGTGVVAMLVKQFLNNFNINENVATVYSNIQCLPEPRKLSSWLIFKIYGLYFVIILYKWNLAFVQRLRTNVIAVHFPRREKKRILHLYNECLKNRKCRHKMIKKLICRQLKSDGNDTEQNSLRFLIDKYTPRLNWLKVFRCLRNKCLICKRVEPFGEDCRLIGSSKVEGLYCNECCEEYEDVFEEIQLKSYSSSETSGSSQETGDSDIDSD